MSEVLGMVLIFGIVSTLLVASMLAFNLAQVGARDRVVALRAESAATRVSGVVVQASIVQERQSATAGATAKVRYLVELPDQLEALAYTVSLLNAGDPGCPTSTGAPAVTAAVVMVNVPADKVCVATALFGANAPANIPVCSNAVSGNPPVGGGHLYVAFDTASPCSATVPNLYVKVAP